MVVFEIVVKVVIVAAVEFMKNQVARIVVSVLIVLVVVVVLVVMIVLAKGQVGMIFFGRTTT